jgi:hypothetical protein
MIYFEKKVGAFWPVTVTCCWKHSLAWYRSSLYPQNKYWLLDRGNEEVSAYNREEPAFNELNPSMWWQANSYKYPHHSTVNIYFGDTSYFCTMRDLVGCSTWLKTICVFSMLISTRCFAIHFAILFHFCIMNMTMRRTLFIDISQSDCASLKPTF